MSESKPQNNFGPFLTMVFLFFIVGFLTTANSQFLGPLKNAFLKNSGSFQNTMATMITFSWFLAYPVFGGVGSWLVRNSGYKGTLIRGLWVMTGGVILTDASAWTTLLWPSAMITLPGETMVHFGFLIFLLGSFVIGGSVTILQVVINPYLVAIDVKGTQPVQRLAIGGTLNSLGTTLAPYFVTGIVFGGLALNKITVDQIIIPFIALAAVLVIVMIIVQRLRLPNLDKTVNKDGERLERSIWSFRHLALGVVAISFYVGSEVCVGSNINLYVLDDFSGSTTTAMLMATLYWGGLMVGRLIGSSLRKITPRTQLAVTTTAASILVLTAIADKPAVGACSRRPVSQHHVGLHLYSFRRPFRQIHGQGLGCLHDWCRRWCHPASAARHVCRRARQLAMVMEPCALWRTCDARLRLGRMPNP